VILGMLRAAMFEQSSKLDDVSGIRIYEIFYEFSPVFLPCMRCDMYINLLVNAPISQPRLRRFGFQKSRRPEAKIVLRDQDTCNQRN
jgi:hypothetical protein